MPGIPTAERIELHVCPVVRDRLIAMAREAEMPIRELATRLICRQLGILEDEGVPVRRPPGRKPMVKRRRPSREK